jgi:Arc/MetJ-type ribon-helix-helix transcriptional regulator
MFSPTLETRENQHKGSIRKNINELYGREKSAMKIITINVPRIYLSFIEELLASSDGLYPSRSELIRVAIRDFLQNEIHVKRYIEEFLAPKGTWVYHTLESGEVIRVKKK